MTDTSDNLNVFPDNCKGMYVTGLARVKELDILATPIFFEDRPSDSPFIERVWRARSVSRGVFTSIAASHWEIIFTRLKGEMTVIIRGPETRATEAYCPPEGEWLAIRFRFGTYIPLLPTGTILDGRDFLLPMTSKATFLFNGSSWELPNYENAECFVQRLAHTGLIRQDLVIETAVQGYPQNVSVRTLQRRFSQVTGLNQEAFRQIERARYAANLLRDGRGIADTTYEAGYFDQSHLTRSLKRLVGMTPTEVARGNRQLSFLYKTNFSR